MAGTFIFGEQEIRPGAYFNIQKEGQEEEAGAVNGVTAVIFQADTGPLCEAVEIDVKDGYEKIFGTGKTTDAMQEAIKGGAKTLIACRVGSGGTSASVTIQDVDGADAVTITAKDSGKKEFAVTIREKLGDETKKECILYDGRAELEVAEFVTGEGEAAALSASLASSGYFTAKTADGKDSAVLMEVSQSAFTGGEDPSVTVNDYADAFAAVEKYSFNTICVDTEDRAVHLLLQAFVARVFTAGLLTQAVVAERDTVELETRMEHAAAFNDEKMHYVLNAHVKGTDFELNGYQTAARIAGMIGACPSNLSLTHTVIQGVQELLEKLTNTQIIAAEKKGCIVLTRNMSTKKIWIDHAINTLVEPPEHMDAGWKKIRRVKTRFELIQRINARMDECIGKLDNDSNGRSTAVMKMQEIGDSMVAEGKLVSCQVSESVLYTADGDSAWFIIKVVDKDSMEHIYLTFNFQFSTRAG